MSAFAPTTATSPRAQLRRALDDAVAGLDAGRAVLLLALDLDDFRRYNAEYGYDAGDAILARVADRLADARGHSFALGADAFALLVDGTPEELWRRAAAAMWSLDPGGDGVELRCSFGAAVVTEPDADTSAALAIAEDRLADQRNRAPSVAERYGELILAILRAQQPDTSEHAFDVAALAAGVAARLGVDPLDRGLVRRAAELHDVGKIAIDPAIVNKPGPLDDDEWAQMRLHTVVGDDLLLAAPPLRAVAPLVRASHERWDGGGYPDGIAGADIPLAARIVAACDAYDAMTTDRCYRRGMSVADARAELERCSGTQFDPAVVAALIAELMEPHRQQSAYPTAVEAAPGTGGSALAAFARLQSQLDAASTIASADELPGALETVAAAVAQTLGFDAVVVSLYRKAWDDFVVSTVHGDESLRAALLGCTYSWQDWESMLSQRFRRGGAYLVYDGEIDWDEQSGKRIVADIEAIDG